MKWRTHQSCFFIGIQSEEDSALSSTAHSQRELQILHLLWPALVEQSHMDHRRGRWGSTRNLKSVVASYMGCSTSFLRLSKINHLDTLCNHLNVVLVLYFSKICCNLASYNYNWARSKGSVFHMCFSFFSFFCKSVFYSLCKCKHSGLHCSSVNTSSFEHVQGDFRKSKPLDSFHVSSLC